MLTIIHKHKYPDKSVHGHMLFLDRHSPRPAKLGLLLSLGLAGCGSLPQPIDTPTPAMPDRFFSAVEELAADTRAVDLTRWWEHAGDTTLNALIARLASDNLDLRAAMARSEQAAAAVRLSSAALRPSAVVSVDSVQTRESLSVAPATALRDLPGGYARSENRVDARAAASWEIDLFGGVALGVSASQSRQEAAAWGVEALRVSLTAQLADLYVQCRAAQVELALVEQALQLQSRGNELLVLLAERGLVADEERLRAQADLASAQTALPALRARVSALLNAMDVLLGDAPGTGLANRSLTAAASGSLPALPDLGRVPAPGRPIELLSRRPDVLAAQAQAQAARATLAQAQRAYYPTFSLGGFAGSVAGGLSGLFSGDSATSQAFLGVRWRIFDFARIDAEIELASGRSREALLQFRSVALRAAHDVEDALVVLNANKQQLIQLQAAQQAAAQAEAAALRARAQGALSERELVHSQRARVLSDLALARSNAERQQRMVQLYRALGAGWTKPDASARSAARALDTITTAATTRGYSK